MVVETKKERIGLSSLMMQLSIILMKMRVTVFRTQLCQARIRVTVSLHEPREKVKRAVNDHLFQ